MNSGPNKMDPNLTGLWVNFFTAAGIPSEVAATYALTFTENRIQNDMLLDLNKEYLRDMGIIRMGDIIAILRHAKQVHESTARDRVLSTTGSNPTLKVPIAAITGRTTVTQPSSPASRILEHYTRNAPVQETSPVRAPQTKRRSNEMEKDELSIKKARLIRFGSPSQSNIPSKEVAAPTNKTVFARLGTSEPALQKTATVAVVQKAVLQKVPPKQVFTRLGSKDNKEKELVPIESGALKYEGILKGAPLAKKVFTVTTSLNNVRKIAFGTMRADEVPVSVKDKLSVLKNKSVKFSNHVEYKEIEANKNKIFTKPKFTQVFNKPERRLSMPDTNHSSVKARLGLKSENQNKFTITQNIFNRLGA